jgi:hypothetical protein
VGPSAGRGGGGRARVRGVIGAPQRLLQRSCAVLAVRAGAWVPVTAAASCNYWREGALHHDASFCTGEQLEMQAAGSQGTRPAAAQQLAAPCVSGPTQQLRVAPAPTAMRQQRQMLCPDIWVLGELLGTPQSALPASAWWVSPTACVWHVSRCLGAPCCELVLMTLDSIQACDITWMRDILRLRARWQPNGKPQAKMVTRWRVGALRLRTCGSRRWDDTNHAGAVQSASSSFPARICMSGSACTAGCRRGLRARVAAHAKKDGDQRDQNQKSTSNQN